MGDAAKPASYSRRVLVAVTGLSPQIVTETLYALAVAGKSPFVPTEIQLITTEEGDEKAKLSLLHPEDGWFPRLCADYALPPIAFGPGQIHVLKSADGEPLPDIRTPDDNTSAADAITEIVRELTADENSALHVSIAGGRKTMGFYLGYALSLYGREQDRLSHVLVNAPFESHPQFFYPTPESRVIHAHGADDRSCDARDAKLTLAEIPFVRLREGLDADLMAGKASFSEVVGGGAAGVPALEAGTGLGKLHGKRGWRILPSAARPLRVLLDAGRASTNGSARHTLERRRHRAGIPLLLRAGREARFRRLRTRGEGIHPRPS